MDDILAEFIAETRETLESLAGEIVAWEADPTDRERLDAIFRFVHTVKGSCGFLDLPRFARLSHAAEDVLDSLRRGDRHATPALVSAVLAVVDRIGELADALDAGEDYPDAGDDLLIAALQSDHAEAAVSFATAGASVQRTATRSIRISLDLLDQLMSGVSDAVLARNELARLLRTRDGDPAIEAAFGRLSGCIAGMRDMITQTRMQRIDRLFAAIPRMVRDIAGDLGKRIELDIDGSDVELDREMIELIRDPLTHIVRNALDHGIESPEQRQAARKLAAGKLSIVARQSGNQILIDIQDDGRGIDPDLIVERALAKGVIDAARADTLSRAERMALIFEPGFSTASEVTEISGRGVGMDVVRSNVERIGGVVEVDSQPGHGTRVSIRVPLTLTIIAALTVRVGDQNFALPRAAVEEIVLASSGSVTIERVGGIAVATIRDRRVPVVVFDHLLGMSDRAPWELGDAGTLVVLNPAGIGSFAVAVSGIEVHEELVIKPAAPGIMAVGLYAGMTLPDTGNPILLIDVAGVAARAGIGAIDLTPTAASDVSVDETLAGELVQTLLFRDLDGAERAIRLALVERIEEVEAERIRFSAGRLRVTMGDRIIPLAGFETLADREQLRVLRLNDGVVEVAYAVDEILDIVPVRLDDIARGPEDSVIGGVLLLDGRQVELVDPYRLFADAAEGLAPAEQRPLCVLDDPDDSWTREILAPLLMGAGYRVALGGAGLADHADVVILTDSRDQTVADGTAPVVRLRRDAPISAEGDDSVWRYDRASILRAVRSSVDRRRAGRGG